MGVTLKIGATLNQRRLAIRFYRCSETVRNKTYSGEVKDFVSDNGVSWRETWQRVEHADGRLKYYELIKIES